MILYKKDTKGNIRYLNVYNEGADIVQESGVLDTPSPIIHRKTAKPKNVGKINETTSEEQTISEINSLIKKKIDGGYFKSLEEAEQENVILPMLAKDYDKEKHKIDWSSAYAQRKLDGMRCLAFVSWGEVKLMSRKGVEIKTMPHIEKVLSRMFPESECILDGELYLHGESFQTNMSLIKKNREGSDKIQYHIYDIVYDIPQQKRLEILKQFENIERSIVVVETIRVFSEVDLVNLHKSFIQEGYEGTMIRWGNETYKINGRSSNLLKYKNFIDDTAVIIDIIPAEQRPEWGTPVFDGFKAGVRMTHEQRVDLLTNKHEYIGKTAEIRFFEYTDEGKPRFPICVGIRNDK